MLGEDNLDCHGSNRSKRYAGRKEVDLLLVFTPANCTDCTSVTDQLTGYWKILVQQEYEKWADDNFEMWESNKLTAGERRILFSKWVKTAWDTLKTKTDLIHQMFQKTGFLIRKDGSDKHLIKVDGIDDYEPPF